jgi:DAK2 domain fusion protein YloV
MASKRADVPLSSSALDAGAIVRAMRAFRDGLETHRSTLNRLNVYPVPDGDTGTNMALTAQAVVDELDAVGEEDMAKVCAAIAHGSLMGARGNSGVILCQILRGMASVLVGSEAVDDQGVRAALAEGAKQARGAVVRPVEGTILTVADGAATAAQAAKGSVVEVLEGARSGALAALWRTPELLPVLAEAGVVDAGGAGLIVLFDAFLCAADGRSMPSELELPASVASLVATGEATQGFEGPANDESASQLRYEVMYLLEATDAAIPAFKEAWAGIGDSIVVVGGDGLWNCHVHTDDIGAAIEAALDVGRPREIRVTDLREQIEEEQWVRQSGQEAPASLLTHEPATPPPLTSVVAVASGEGLRRIFLSLGVRDVVAGGQSMNPSTAEILEAVETAAGAHVVILPNNANIVPVAEQVAGLSSKRVQVVATRSIQEGFAALLEYDPQCSCEENASAMDKAARRVVAGEVTRAARAGETSAGRVEPGDYLGLSARGVEVVAASLAEATCGLLERLIEADHEIVTLIEGAGSSPATTRAVSEWLREKHPGLVIERHLGGQPLYPYLVSLE